MCWEWLNTERSLLYWTRLVRPLLRNTQEQTPPHPTPPHPTPPIKKEKKKEAKPSSSSSSSISLSWIFVLWEIYSHHYNHQISLSRKVKEEENRNNKKKQNDVNPSQEEVDEGFQEAAAGSTCRHQWCSPRQQHHALERCYFWVPFSFFFSFIVFFSWFLINLFVFFIRRPDDTPWDGGG